MKDSFEKNAYIPTDHDISALVGGVPVLSFFPEDLPHYDDFYAGACSVSQNNDRMYAVYNKIKRFLPAWDGSIHDTSCLASNNTASVMTWYRGPQKTPGLFVLLKPSPLLDPARQLTLESGLDSQSIKCDIPKNDLDFIAYQHEVGHMVSAVRGQEYFLNPFEKELNADTYALDSYLSHSGDVDIVKTYIHQRAIMAFFKQPPQYWIAPVLRERFLYASLDMNSRYEIGDFSEAIRSVPENGELVLRVANYLLCEGDLEAISSEEIQDLFLKELQGNIGPQDNLGVLAKMKQAHVAYYSGEYEAFDAANILNGLKKVIHGPNVNSGTHDTGQFILTSAAQICPDLLHQDAFFLDESLRVNF